MFSSGVTSGFGSGGTGDINIDVAYDYSKINSTSQKNSYSAIPSSLNGDVAQFSWWKRKIYIHIVLIDDELWDIIEDGVCFQVDSEGMVLHRKSLIDVQKEICRKNHRVHGFLVETLPHSQYVKIVDRSTNKSIF